MSFVIKPRASLTVKTEVPSRLLIIGIIGSLIIHSFKRSKKPNDTSRKLYLGSSVSKNIYFPVWLNFIYSYLVSPSRYGYGKSKYKIPYDLWINHASTQRDIKLQVVKYSVYIGR